MWMWMCVCLCQVHLYLSSLHQQQEDPGWRTKDPHWEGDRFLLPQLCYLTDVIEFNGTNTKLPPLLWVSAFVRAGCGEPILYWNQRCPHSGRAQCLCGGERNWMCPNRYIDMTQKNVFKSLLFVCLHWQNKMHPREWNRDVQFRGRVRVQLKQADGNLCLDKFTSRESWVNVMKVNILSHWTGSSQGLSCQSSQGECQQMELVILLIVTKHHCAFYWCR